MIEEKITNKSNCTGCHGCYAVCPTRCISMNHDNEGFLYPKVDRSKCVQCHQCIEVCPVIHPLPVNQDASGYACINQNEAERFNSSSGGIFSLLAQKVLEQGGKVFGAAFDQAFMVRHEAIENSKDLYLLQGSKYLQSRIGDTFEQVKALLNDGKHVLFSGTPCQVAGLKSFLGKKYDHLAAVDIVCHGVPSPKAWEKYLKYMKERKNDEVNAVFFRCKEKGWRKFALRIVFQKGASSRTLDKDPYMQAFLQDICLRPSCYACKFKGVHRPSDITLADFWGIEHINRSLDDDKGTSLVITHSDQGNRMLKSIQPQAMIAPVEIGEAVRYNVAAVASASMHRRRSDFMRELDSVRFDKLVRKYCHVSGQGRIKLILIRILAKTGMLDAAKKVKAKLIKKNGNV